MAMNAPTHRSVRSIAFELALAAAVAEIEDEDAVEIRDLADYDRALGVA